MKVFGNIDLTLNEIQNVRIERNTVDTDINNVPGVEGQILYLTQTQKLYICIQSSPSVIWTNLSKGFSYVWNQTTPASSWTASHSLGTTDVIVQVYDDSDNRIIPDNISITDANNVSVTFTSPITGKVVIISVDTANAVGSNSFSVGDNLLVDGDFESWDHGTSQTTSGYGSDTMWRNTHGGGSTKTHTRQSFVLGQTDVDGNPLYFSRTVVTSGNSTGNYVYKYQTIPGLRKLSGKDITFSFNMKADTGRPVAVEFVQNFGTGGTPSATVNGIGVSKVNITSSWDTYSVTASIPSIAGKTLGTNGDDHLFVRIWYDAGTDFNSLTDTLGSQSGTFDLARCRLVYGSVTGESIMLDSREELERVRHQYFKMTNPQGTGFLGIMMATAITATAARGVVHHFPMIRDPDITLSGAISSVGGNLGTLTGTITYSSAESDYRRGVFVLNALLSGGNVGNTAEIRFNNDVNGYLEFDARL